MEARRRHTDNRGGRPPEGHAASDHPWIGAEAPAPEIVADDHRRGGIAIAVVLRRQQASRRGSRAEHAEVVTRHHFAPDPYRVLAGGGGSVDPDERRHVGRAGQAIAHVGIVGIRKGLELRGRRAVVVDRDQFGRPRGVERPAEGLVEQACRQGAGKNAQGEGRNCREGRGPAAPEESPGGTEVLEHRR